MNPFTWLDHLSGGARWTWPTTNANHLGLLAMLGLVAAVGMVTGLAAPAAASIEPSSTGHLTPRARRFLTVVLAALGIWCAVALTYSQSRGCWVAAGAGLALIAIQRSQQSAWWWSLGAAALLALLILSSSGALHRAGIMLHPGDDGSWQGRLKLWHASLVLIRDFPLAGIGYGGFADYFTMWFKDPAQKEAVVLVINEPLQYMCTLGLGMAFAYGLLVALVWSCWRLARSGRGPWALVSTACLASYLVASLFTCFVDAFILLQPVLLLAVAALIGGTALCLVLELRRQPGIRRRVLVTGGMITVGTGLIIAAATFLLACWSATGEPVRVMRMRSATLASGLSVLLPGGEPRRQSPTASVLVLLDHRDQAPEVCSNVLRPLIASGFAATIAGPDARDQPALTPPVVLLAMGSGCAAVPAYRARLHPAGVILIDADDGTVQAAAADDAGTLPGSADRVQADPTPAVAPAPCPIFAIRGSRGDFAAAADPPAWFASLPHGSRWRSPPWGHTWLRQVHRLMPDLLAWMSTVAPRQQP